MMCSRSFFILEDKKCDKANNRIMNQIIVLKQMNKRRRSFFKFQFVVSVLALIMVFFFSMNKRKKDREMMKFSETMNRAFQVETMYTTKQDKKEITDSKNSYFGKITIPKIELEYSIFNTCDDELLKILPCKFYGQSIEQKGNIAIAGHNYEDHRFFGNLHKLQVGDTIYLEDLTGIFYRYTVYDKYKVQPDDFNCLKAQKTYDLTLVTCDNLNAKRLVIKASRKI